MSELWLRETEKQDCKSYLMFIQKGQGTPVEEIDQECKKTGCHSSCFKDEEELFPEENDL